MTKVQQIKEIKKFIKDNLEYEMADGNDEYATEVEIDYKGLAIALYDAGYRKTFTSDLATEKQQAYKEGYEKGFSDGQQEFKIIKIRNYELKAERDNIHENYVAILKHNAYLRNELRESKAEAVKEFTEKLQVKCNGNKGYEYSLGNIQSVIDELLKEYEK